VTINFPSLCNCVNTTTPCTYAGLLGFWPIVGMGTFNDNATPFNCAPVVPDGDNGVGMDDIWPNVYRTLTLVWSDSGGTQTDTYNYQDCCDAPCVYATSGTHSGAESGGWNFDLAITPTTLRQTYICADQTTGVFTASLSNQWLAGGYGNWAQKTANALALIINTVGGLKTPLAAPSSAFNTVVYYPISTGALVASTTIQWACVCAAAMGLPVRAEQIMTSFSFGFDQPALAAIYDLSIPGPIRRLNFGGVICLASNWNLTGVPYRYGSTLTTDHKTIFAQQFSAASFAMGGILQPAPDFWADVSATITTPAQYVNPITPVLPVSFTPADVAKNLGQPPGTCGMVGFNSIFAGHPPISIGAFPASGGAGGTGPGAGGGAPPM